MKEDKHAQAPQEELSPEQQAEKETIMQHVDVRDVGQVLSFGHEAQQKISTFSDKVLESVRTRDTGEVSDMLTGLVAQLRGFDTQGEKKGFLGGLFQNAGNKLTTMKAQYDKVEVNVAVITDALSSNRNQLLDDIHMLDQLYQLNQQHFRELNLYIAAGEEKLHQLREEELPVLVARAEESEDAADAQAARDFADQIDRFEKKIHDLRLTRTVSIQMAPQVRLMQNNDSILAEKIQSTLVNTIPLWKSQMVIAMGLSHADRALQAQQAVTDVTNELLRKNAQALKQGTIQTAQAAERGAVDIETIRETNQALIQTLDEVQKIHTTGAAARRAAEAELVRLEDELKHKLLDFRGKTEADFVQPSGETKI